VLFAVLKAHPTMLGPAIAIATLGNTLGGMSSYCIGRFIPRLNKAHDARAERWRAPALRWAQRYGSPAMLLAWVPLIGDPLCVVAGWLRLNWLSVALFMALGKLARYLIIAWAT
jgi:membrane protein YqaA with SNARE-associated domain